MKRNTEYYNKKVSGKRYGPALRGLGGTVLNKQRGLKGGTYGPAGPGRKLSKDEITSIENQMRQEGKL